MLRSGDGPSLPHPADAMNELRVVLVNYRCLDGIERLLRSGALDGTDVVLVDNASDPDELIELAAEFGARHLTMTENVGFARAVNAAAAMEARSGRPPDAMVLLNPDVLLDRRDLDTLVERLRQTGADAVGPRLVEESGRTWVSSAGGPVTLRSVVWYFAGVSHLLPSLSGFFWTRRQIASRGPARPHWLCGACLVARGDAFERFGGLPTDEIVYGEDVGWGIDVVRRGGQLHLARDVCIVHIGGASGGSDVWVDATARMFVRRLGRVRGTLAGVVMRIGLAARRFVRRMTR